MREIQLQSSIVCLCDNHICLIFIARFIWLFVNSALRIVRQFKFSLRIAHQIGPTYGHYQTFNKPQGRSFISNARTYVTHRLIWRSHLLLEFVVVSYFARVNIPAHTELTVSYHYELNPREGQTERDGWNTSSKPILVNSSLVYPVHVFRRRLAFYLSVSNSELSTSALEELRL